MLSVFDNDGEKNSDYSEPPKDIKFDDRVRRFVTAYQKSWRSIPQSRDREAFTPPVSADFEEIHDDRKVIVDPAERLMFSSGSSYLQWANKHIPPTKRDPFGKLRKRGSLLMRPYTDKITGQILRNAPQRVYKNKRPKYNFLDKRGFQTMARSANRSGLVTSQPQQKIQQQQQTLPAEPSPPLPQQPSTPSAGTPETPLPSSSRSPLETPAPVHPSLRPFRGDPLPFKSPPPAVPSFTPRSDDVPDIKEHFTPIKKFTPPLDPIRSPVPNTKEGWVIGQLDGLTSDSPKLRMNTLDILLRGEDIGGSMLAHPDSGVVTQVLRTWFNKGISTEGLNKQMYTNKDKRGRIASMQDKSSGVMYIKLKGKQYSVYAKRDDGGSWRVSSVNSFNDDNTPEILLDKDGAANLPVFTDEINSLVTKGFFEEDTRHGVPRHS